MNLSSNKKQACIKIAVMAACFSMILVCLGFCSSNKSIYLSAITQALGIKRSLFSINDSCRYIATAVVNIFFGALIQRFGAKKLVGAGFFCLIVSTLIYANATHVWVFYIGGCFLGIGLAWTTTTMASYLVNRWFSENRGTMSGLILCANGLGGALAAQIVTPLIYEEGNPFGYRNAYHLVALLLLIVGIVVVLAIREPAAAPAPGVSKKGHKGKKWEGISFSEAARQPFFYAAVLCVFLTGMSLQGINGIAAAHLGDVGMDKGIVATVLSVHSVVLCMSKLLAGFSYDKLGLRRTLLICELFGVLSFLALAFSGSDSVGTANAIAWSVLSALAMPLETVMVPLIAADMFGEKDFSKMVGIFVSMNTAGYAFGTPVANLIFDQCGTYKPMLLLTASIMVLIAGSFWFIINAAGHLRRQIVSVEGNSSKQ